MHPVIRPRRRAPVQREAAPSKYITTVAATCRAEGWPEPTAERLLIPGRRFRCDLVWDAARLVVEVQGGVWLPKGGHTGGRAQLDDMEKLNLLQLAGWRVLQVPPKGILDGTLRDLLARIFVIGSDQWPASRQEAGE